MQQDKQGAKRKFSVDDLLEVKIEKIVPRGLGMGFAEGLTVFVTLAAEGDVIRARVEQIKGKTAFAAIEEIISPSSDRTTPPCPYYGICGGCDLQHLRYEKQLAAKSAIISDCLRRIGKIEWPHAILVTASPNEFDYRSRAQWHLDRDKQRIGYLRRASHEVIDIEQCLILLPELESSFLKLREEISWGGIWSDVAVIEAAAGKNGTSLYSADMVLPGGDVIQRAGEFEYRYSAQSFFQGNPFLIEALVDAAVEGTDGRLALDLYCGVGLFTLALSKRFKRVIGIEGNPTAVEYARRNADQACLTNIEFAMESVERGLGENKVAELDLVLLDPPRSGPEKPIIDRIIQMRPAAISYVSCDPAILARDLRHFIDGGYRVDSIRAFDLFPQTHHVETVARLSLS
ncbi:MAG: class I SAM-dependent RNA methyltransferase [Acidobacteriota bacterium]